MRLVLAAILLCCGCGPRPAERLDALWAAASDDLHAGELSRALSATDHGIALATERSDLVYQWKFRLLRCDILLYSGRTEEVPNQLLDEVPSTTEFAALAARKLVLQARALSTLGYAAEGEARLAEARHVAEA